MNRTKVGLTGLGRIGKVHLRSLAERLPEVEVIAVSDVSPDTQSIANSYGIPFFYDNFEELLARDDIEAVIICSPTFTHHNYIVAAAKAGKHIFCEKPLEMTLEKIRDIDAVVKADDVKLQVGFNRRFDPSFAQIRLRVAHGDIGALHILTITSRDPAPPSMEYLKGSGGLFLDMTIHDFDIARFIIGSEVKEVYAHGSVLIDQAIAKVGDIDTAVVVMKFENGATAVINNSRKSVYGYDQRLEIFGSKGMANIENHYPDTHNFYDGSGGHFPPALDFFMERYAEAYFNEMKAFIAAIQNNEPVPVNSGDALAATRIALAANLSMKENRPVEISEIT